MTTPALAALTLPCEHCGQPVELDRRTYEALVAVKHEPAIWMWCECKPPKARP